MVLCRPGLLIWAAIVWLIIRRIGYAPAFACERWGGAFPVETMDKKLPKPEGLGSADCQRTSPMAGFFWYNGRKGGRGWKNGKEIHGKHQLS